jgi:processive 1,2-diacylglycerol beta-glucosyltransferase
MGPRILIASASIGTGHLRAAEALELVLRQRVPEGHIENVDVLAMATAPFRRCYGQMYLDLIRWAPHFLGLVYDHIDKPKAPGNGPWYRLRVLLERVNLRPFVHLVESQPWDLIISTFFLPAEIVASLRRAGRIDTPQVMVTTDFETHRNWVAEPCEHYFTATEEAALYLECLGVPKPAVTATGIPIHPVFSQPKDRRRCLVRHGLRGGRPIVVVLAGGHGVGPITEIFGNLLAIRLPLELVVVTGHNRSAQHELAALVVPQRHRVKVLGYTEQMDELLAVADLVVSKPGGLTTAETLARGAGMIIVQPVPGQEQRNSDFLLENGAAIKVNHIPTLGHKVTAVLTDADWLARLKANALRLGRPRATFDIVDQSLTLSRQPAQEAAFVDRRARACGRGPSVASPPWGSSADGGVPA